MPEAILFEFDRRHARFNASWRVARLGFAASTSQKNCHGVRKARAESRRLL